MRTSVAVERVGERHAVRLAGGPLRPWLVGSDARRCRVGLLATTALLLGGDTVELDVEVGPGATLELFDVAGTVAYDGRGAPAVWDVRVRVAARGVLRYAGQPLVVADGADVTRALDLDAAAGATVLLRDTVVLGRSGERGGRLRSVTGLDVDGAPVLREDQGLDPDRGRTDPGLLGPHRVLDTVTVLGAELAPVPEAPRYALVGGAGTLTRWLGSGLARSPLHQAWAATGSTRAAAALVAARGPVPVG